MLLRKVGKSNREHFEELRRRLFSKLKHEFSYSGVLRFANSSQITAGHYQAEKDIATQMLRFFIAVRMVDLAITHQRILVGASGPS